MDKVKSALWSTSIWSFKRVFVSFIELNPQILRLGEYFSVFIIYAFSIDPLVIYLLVCVQCFVFIGGRINGRDVWIYNSQLNIWIRVASLNKGRWRHKMAVLLGKVRETTFCYYCWYLSRINTTDESFILLTLWVFWTQFVFPFISNLST